VRVRQATVAERSNPALTPVEQESGARLDPLHGALVSGKFRIDRVLASGGMGRVHVAPQESIDRRVRWRSRSALATWALALGAIGLACGAGVILTSTGSSSDRAAEVGVARTARTLPRRLVMTLREKEPPAPEAVDPQDDDEEEPPRPTPTLAAWPIPRVAPRVASGPPVVIAPPPPVATAPSPPKGTVSVFHTEVH